MLKYAHVDWICPCCEISSSDISSLSVEDSLESDCDSQPTGSQLPPPPSDRSNSSQTRNVKGKYQKNKLRILLVKVGVNPSLKR